MNQKLVSIIIPAYNAEKYIEESIRSALNSEYLNFEIIVVNDGSTDSTQVVLERLMTQHSSLKVYQQTNSGVAAARNYAILKSNGTYILPLDADDIISKNFVSEAVKILEQQPSVKVVGCEAEFIGDRSGRWQLKPFKIDILCVKNLIPCTAMYRKEEWRRVGGYCEEQMGREDWDFWLSILRKEEEFIRLPFVGFYYRIHKNSKRIADRLLKNKTTDILNIRHKPLFFKHLNGKLHYQRTHSKKINNIISLCKPYHVFIQTNNPIYEKFIYAANESDAVKEFINVPHEEIDYLSYEEKRIHIPFTKIKKSKARSAFDLDNESHLGYYEEQISLFRLKSYLVLLKPS